MTDTTNPTVDADGRMLSDAAANLKLYDTASHAVEPFVPVQPGHVGIYVCGATVQSSPHIGSEDKPNENRTHIPKAYA